MNNGLVSIIVPTYNRAYCLPRTIDSVLSQTYSTFELVIVDDGSTDETRALVTGMAAHDDRIRYLYQPNAGVSAARNCGLRAARGDYIALLDSDDVWKPWKLEVQLACLSFLPQVGMVWTNMEAVNPEGQVTNPSYLRTMYDAYRWFRTEELFFASYSLREVLPDRSDLPEATLYVGDIFSPMLVGNLVHTSTALMRRQRVEQVKGGFDETLRLAGEDHDFHFRVCREGPVALLDVSSIQYQVGMPDRLSRHKLMVATNYLQTVTTRLKHDGDRIRLPRSVIERVLARAEQWVGSELWYAGEPRKARRHLAASLWRRPWQPRTAGLLLLSCLPQWLSQALLGLYGRLKYH
jgi:glycosyltransferase involved in cell wall biosynthesis